MRAVGSVRAIWGPIGGRRAVGAWRALGSVMSFRAVSAMEALGAVGPGWLCWDSGGSECYRGLKGYGNCEVFQYS